MIDKKNKDRVLSDARKTRDEQIKEHRNNNGE